MDDLGVSLFQDGGHRSVPAAIPGASGSPWARERRAGKGSTQGKTWEIHG